MIALALALIAQATTPEVTLSPPAPAIAAAAPAAPRVVAIDPDQAVALFQALCVPNLQDAGAFATAVHAAPLPFVAVQRRDPGAGQAWRADRALVSYGPNRAGAVQCSLFGRLAGTADQLGFSGRVEQALALKPGRTRVGHDQAATDWTAPGADGHVVTISAATRTAGGGTDIRLSATLSR